MLRVPAELLDFKFRVLKWKGYKLIEPPISAQKAISLPTWRCRMMQTATVNKPLKVYVAVKADFAADGTMFPRIITWEGGENMR